MATTSRRRTGRRSTPIHANQGTYARPKVKATTWADWTSLRAGTSEPITGSGSYSQADASNSVTCFWQQLSGPSTVTFASRTSCETTVSGTVFGPYQFALTATGADGSVGTSTIDVGAVATDGNGVVIQGNPAADLIYGPMIAFGRNPWAYPDDAALRALTVRGASALATSYPKDWLTLRAGTIEYYPNYLATGTYRTTLNGSITTSSTTITVTDATKLRLGSLPTAIMLGFNGEYVLISAVTGNDLTVAPDGRGWGGTTAAAYASGVDVFQSVAFGTSTSFKNDYCSGRIGPFTGTNSISAGTISATPGSTTLTNAGGGWNGDLSFATGNIFVGMIVRFTGVMTGTGIPFEFMTTVASKSTGPITTLEMARAFPAAANAVSGSTYQMFFDNASFVPAWVRPDSTNGLALLTNAACISDTQLIYRSGLEVYGSALLSGKTHSKTTQNWATSGGNGTINFYDEVAANYAMYLRSGSQAALNAARYTGDDWINSPWIDEGWGIQVSTPRNVSAFGILASWQLDGRNWSYGIRQLAAQGSAELTRIGNNCFLGDTRETSYQMMWMAMAALYDPDPVQRAIYLARLEAVKTREDICQDSAGYTPNYIYFNPTFSNDITMTNGSTAVSGTGFTNAATCASSASGTGGVTNGSAIMTGSGIPTIPASFGSIGITGTRGGQPYVWRGQYSGSGASITLSAVWQGDDNVAVPFVIHEESGDFRSVAFGIDAGDPNVREPYDCIYNSPTSLTLTSPWRGTTSTVIRATRANLVGPGVQPFMAGIKAYEYYISGKATSGATKTTFETLGTDISNWIKTNGYDPKTKGMRYGAGFTICEPPGTAPGWNAVTLLSTPQFDWTVLGCQHGNSVVGGAVAAARALSAEAQTAMRLIYEAAPTTPNRDFGDEFYGAIYGKNGLTAPGFPDDGGYTNTYIENSGLSAGKWYGFHFGVGMAHQWPAVRLGGVTPKTTVAKPIQARLADISGAVDIVVDYLAADGTVTPSSPCTSAACTFATDARQNYLYRVRYRNGSAANLAVGAYLPVR
jgi:hypothetical protein